MKPPPRDDIDTNSAAGLLEELSLAVRSGKLVALLKGKGLTRSTIEELLRPESALTLKAILTDQLFPEWDRVAHEGLRNRGEDDPGRGTADSPRRGGKLLVYQKKETFRP
jgi:hypothetical protein